MADTLIIDNEVIPYIYPPDFIDKNGNKTSILGQTVVLNTTIDPTIDLSFIVNEIPILINEITILINEP
ncbi:MAG: hypothetical protein ABIP51_20690 [Bacteroidia bacterium]